MKEIRVLILGMGGNVSQGILKAIRNSGLNCYVVGACVSPDSEGLYFCDNAYISPYAASEEFIPWLFKLCTTERINIVFSGVEEVVEAVSPVRESLSNETGAIFRTSSPDKLEIGRDKFLTCHWLKENGFRAPECCASGDAEGLFRKHTYPLIAKPRKGKGSNGVFIIENRDDLVRAMQLSDYVVQEYVGSIDHEYTVGCYRGLNGFMPDPIIMRRELKNGASWKIEVVEDTVIRDISKQICATFLPDGPLNIQLRFDKNGVPVPFEFNVRFSGTTPMRTHFGFCDVKAMLYESVLGRDISPCFCIHSGIAYRYTEELYLESMPLYSETGRIYWKTAKSGEAE